MHAAIRAASEKGLKEYVINSSRRLGKSFLLCTIAIEWAIQHPGSEIRFVAPTTKALKKITRPLFKKILRDCPHSMRPIYRAIDAVYLFPNGSEIHLAGANQGHDEDLRGTGADLVIVDEAAFVDDLNYLVDDILTPQLLDRWYSNGMIILSSTPPKTPAHDFTQRAQLAMAEGFYSEFNIWQSDYPEHVIRSFQKKAGGENSTTWLREYMCQFVVDEESAIIPEWRDKFVKTPDRPQAFQFFHRYEAMDIGGTKHFTALPFGYYDFLRGVLVIEDEFAERATKMTNKILAETIKGIEGRLWPGLSIFRRVADNNNPVLLADLASQYGVSFRPTTKDNLHAMVNYARTFIAAGRLEVSPKCSQLIGCLKFGIWTDNRKEFATSALYGHFDMLAALIYLIRDLDQYTNPIPPDYNIAQDTHFVPAGLQRNVSRDGQELEKLFKKRRP